ncbi:hypothetical protein PLEOSDRAFT_1098722 [Pleurotus ostreatus PC15]|uniref:Uncharacterized protein n=1 Tax=Pleurotus ostreatus (strain PC15) TaxID=1137138 RepID=A0A067P8J6_PLEO1|nr:hypothetical protein PLEOSDRAFT_1098722 [Pleurotus ostreatus PC15]
MSRLKKSPPMERTSNTMRAALALVHNSPQKSSIGISVSNRTPVISQGSIAGTEAYWASRAMMAESALAAQTSRQGALQYLSYKQEVQSARDLAMLSSANDAKHAMLERVVLLLIGCVVLLVSVVIYLAVSTHHRISKQTSSWLTLPSHFTIPILSPFTSVVEHETSMLSSRTIAMLVLSLVCLLYFMFRLWLHRRPTT